MTTFNIEIDDLSTAFKKAERAIVLEALKAGRYKQSRAAELLGISRGTMRTKLIEHFGYTYVSTRENKQ